MGYQEVGHLGINLDGHDGEGNQLGFPPTQEIFFDFFFFFFFFSVGQIMPM